jgi:hypothetical protein
VAFGAAIDSAMSAISWSLVNAMVVFLPYQIRWLCSELRRYRASPCKWRAAPIAYVDTQIDVWFDTTTARCQQCATQGRKTAQSYHRNG